MTWKEKYDISFGAVVIFVVFWWLVLWGPLQFDRWTDGGGGLWDLLYLFYLFAGLGFVPSALTMVWERLRTTGSLRTPLRNDDELE